MLLDQSLKNLCVGVRAGGSIVTHRPIFSRDTKSIYVVCSNTVLVYSTATCLSIGKIRAPNAEIIANISISPLSKNSLAPETIFILTTSGILFEVDPSTQEVLAQANLNHGWPAEWMRIGAWLNIICVKVGTFLAVGVPDHSEEAILYLVTKNEEKHEAHLQLKRSNYNLTKLCWKILHNVHAISFGAGGHLVAAVQEDAVFMTDFVENVSKFHKSGSRKFTCVACHPEEWIVATGDDSGRILLWRDFLSEKSPPKSVFHWHTLPVSDLCFTLDGTQMLSGSGECTLVKWDIIHSDNKRTLPRMGLPIRHINVSRANTLIATSHADNCIQLVDAQNNIIGSIQNITQCYIPEGESDQNASTSALGGSTVFQAGLQVDPRNNSLVMNGRPGHLQSYSYAEDKHLYTLDITQQNFVTAERQKAIPNSDVCHVAFSKLGTWLATGESLLDSQKCIELRLKFWKFEAKKQIFVLNTTIHWPHENGIVNLKIQPIDDDDLSILAASSGMDNKFKTWGIVSDHSLHGKEEWWSCENIGSYRNLKAGPLAFSRDGSVLAAPFAHILTLWTCDNHQMKGTLCHAKLEEDIRLVEFGCHLSSHLVICATDQNLVVWDVITLTLLWAVPLKVQCISADPLSNLVAAFSTKNHVYFFRPDSPQPIAHHNNISRSKVISSVFVPNPSNAEFSSLKSTLMFVNSSQELCSLLPKRTEENLPEVVRVQTARPESTLTPFAQLIAEKTILDAPTSAQNLKVQSNKIGLPGCQVIREIMDSSPHTMPSVTFFCDQLLAAISTPKNPSDKLDSMEQYVTSSFKTITEESTPQSQATKSKTKQAHLPEVKRMDSEEKSTRAKSINVDLDEIMNEDISWIQAVFQKPDQISD